jgi:hypothetical protein
MGRSGAACFRERDCEPDLWCADNVCAMRAAKGAECSPGSGECQAGLACNPTTHSCDTRPSANPGAACDSFTVCRGGSCVCDGGLCASTNDALDRGNCSTLIADGQACDPTSLAARCDDFAICQKGTCQGLNKFACE